MPKLFIGLISVVLCVLIISTFFLLPSETIINKEQAGKKALEETNQHVKSRYNEKLNFKIGEITSSVILDEYEGEKSLWEVYILYKGEVFSYYSVEKNGKFYRFGLTPFAHELLKKDVEIIVTESNENGS